jgi:hypothetical protein
VYISYAKVWNYLTYSCNMNEKEILMKIAEIILWAIHLVANVNIKSDIIRMEHFNGSNC